MEAFCSFWKDPAGQGSHVPMLGLGAYVPGMQGNCFVLPVGA